VSRDVAWGYLAQFLQYGAALLVLPLLLRELTAPELGLWYVFMTIAVLVTMLDMGFTPTLARNVSYVMGGARRLLPDGFETADRPGEVDDALLAAVVGASRTIFRWASVAALALLAGPGTAYVVHVARGEIEPAVLGASWAVFVLATVVNLYFKYYTPLLQGRGLYAAFYRASAISNLAFVGVTAVALLAGGGLLAVAGGYLVSALVGRALSARWTWDPAFRRRVEAAGPPPVPPATIVRTLWHNAWRLGVGVIGAFLILRGNTLLASAYLGLATTAAYALTLQVMSAVQSTATVAFNVQQPRLAQLRVAGDRVGLARTVERSLELSVAVYVACALALLAVGPALIASIGANTSLLPVPLLAWVAAMVLLELVHTLAAGVIVSGNTVPFVAPALLSGLAIVAIAWAGLHHGGQGVAWLIGTQFAVQLAYNNWKWPYVVYRDVLRGARDAR